MKLDARTTSRRGFTLVEVLISVTLLATLLGSLFLLISQGSDVAGAGLARQSIEAEARRALDRMANELRSAGSATLTPNPTSPWGSDHLTFRRISGYAGGAVQWDDQASFSLALEEGETNNGVDDNGNGLVDERVLVYARDPSGANERTILVHDVRELLEGELQNGVDDNANGLKDEAGLSFVHAGGILTMRLSLEELDSRGETRVKTVETSIRLRN